MAAPPTSPRWPSACAAGATRRCASTSNAPWPASLAPPAAAPACWPTCATACSTCRAATACCYFRPTNATVNLTVASVPLVLQVESIRADQDICTWSGAFAGDVVAGKPVALQQWLRFDDQPWLPAALDQLLAETRRDRAEFGFSPTCAWWSPSCAGTT